ncbi:hypothetical protein BGZ99_005050 [Dissophora globulifera]|uniref:N-acetyltransferase domain-containing protein n=1 Tax=Dissophora globulifera TaxID=979702 RepID=A0A9P6RVL6_9FUNG|nr:hypothetical protein BGZ99_005050 [Dissophora globulifera]
MQPAITSKNIRLRPYLKEDYDQLIAVVLYGFDALDKPLFVHHAKKLFSPTSILFRSTVYTLLIQLALIAFSNSTSFSSQDLGSLREALILPGTAQRIIRQLLQPSFLAVWIFVSLAVAAVKLVSIYRWTHSTNRSFFDASVTDDLSDIDGYYQSQRAASVDKGKKNRSRFWVACLDSHPQTVVGCVALDDCWAHTEYLRKKHLSHGGTEDNFEAPREGYGELRRLFVHQNYRRLGISRMLIDALVEHAKEHGFEHVFFTTTYFQIAAVYGYIRYGFQKEKSAILAVYKLWFGTMKLHATEKEKQKQKSEQTAMIQEINAFNGL